MGSWRLLTADGVEAAAGLACDEALARCAGDPARPTTLRLYTYRPHCALVGRFQDPERELDLAACAALGVAVDRRPTGGGAILMGPDQLGVALAVHGRGADLGGRPRQLMQRFAAGLVTALADLGITAGFRGKNDLEVGGRKIAGLGIYRDPSGGLLFHASLLVDLDVALMTRVLRTPFRRVTARELAIVARRTTTVRECLARPLPVAEVRAAVAAGFARAFAVRLEPGALAADEVAVQAELLARKYGTADWLAQCGEAAETDGRARQETPVGGVEVQVACAGAQLKAVHLRGDFFADQAAVADLEWRLRWHSTAPAAVLRTVDAWSRRHPDAGLPPRRIAELIAAALRDAEGERAAAPYGCFVNPGGGPE